MNIAKACIKHKVATLLAVIMVVIFGVLFGTRLQMALMPNMEMPMAVVMTTYVGANPSDIEELVTSPLESAIMSVSGVDEITSTSAENVSTIQITYLEGTDLDIAATKLREQFDRVSLPDDASDPIIVNINISELMPTAMIALVGDDLSQLQAKAEDDIAPALERIDGVAQVQVMGGTEQHIAVRINPAKAAGFGLSNSYISQFLAGQNLLYPGGDLQNGTQKLTVSTDAKFQSVDDVANTIIALPAGGPVRLSEVASVALEDEDSTAIAKVGDTGCVMLQVSKQSGANEMAAAQAVEKRLAELKADDPTLQYTIPYSAREYISQSVNAAFSNIIQGVVLAAIVVFLFLRRGGPTFTICVSMPVCILSVFVLMNVFDLTLNMMSLGGIAMGVGMIVDNSIIVIDAYLEYLDKGYSRWYAAVYSAKNYFSSILLATLCICVIFFPLLFTMTGQMLDFVTFFPWTLSISLMVSLAVAMVFIPLLERVLIKKGLKSGRENTGKKRFNLLDTVQAVYTRALTWTFRFPKTTIGLGVLTVALAILMITQLSQRMMPIADRDQFAVEIYLPQGTSLDRTAAVSDSLYKLLSEDERILSVTSFIGTSSPRFQATYAPNLAGKNYAQFIVNTASIEATRSVLDDYTDRYADYFPDAYVKFKQLDYQNVSSPLEIRFMGDDIARLKQAGDSLMAVLREMDGLVWVHTNYEEALPDVRVRLDPVEASRLGITKAMASADLAIRYDGLSVGSLWEGDYALPIQLRSDKKGEGDAFDKVGDQYLPTIVPGVSVPLRQVSTIEGGWNEGQIVRRNGVRTLSVFAEVTRGTNQNAMQKRIERVMESHIIPTLPEGVTYEYGGAKELDFETMNPLMQGLAIAVIIVFFFLLVNFKKIGLALAALSSLLLTLFGAALGLWAFHIDFSLTCVLGVISLIGIVVRNAILIFEHAQDLRLHKHYSPRDAAFDAGRRRMLPIFLTSATTAVGVVPMIISGSSLWMPMGVVICSGTVFSMILAVIILPVFYWKIFGNK